MGRALRRRAGASATSVMLGLHAGARHISIRAEHTTVAREWSQLRPTLGAVVANHSGVLRHRHQVGMATLGAGDDRLKDNVNHGGPPIGTSVAAGVDRALRSGY